MSAVIEVDFKLDGKSHFLLDNTKTDYLMQIIRKDPCSFERNVVMLYSRLCQKNKLKIVDVGANIGIYSIIAATINPTCHVDAFEPSPSNFNSLCQNLLLNNINTVRPINKALGKNESRIPLYIPDNEEISSVSSMVEGFTELFHDKVNSTIVDVVALDEFYKDRFQEIDLIKLDAEFFENEILLGGENLINTSKPIVICEALFYEVHKHKYAHPRQIHDDLHSYKIESFFKNKNYLSFAIGVSGILKVDTIHHHPDDRNFVFIPFSIELDSLLFIPYSTPNFNKLVFGS